MGDRKEGKRKEKKGHLPQRVRRRMELRRDRIEKKRNENEKGRGVVQYYK